PELSPEVPEPAGLLRAPGGVVLRIEIDDDVLAPELRERHSRPGTVLQREGRGLAPLHDLRHGSPRPRPGRPARGPRRVQEDGAARSRRAGVTGLVHRARSSAAVVAGRPVTAAARAAARSAGSRRPAVRANLARTASGPGTRSADTAGVSRRPSRRVISRAAPAMVAPGAPAAARAAGGDEPAGAPPGSRWVTRAAMARKSGRAIAAGANV